MGAFELSKLYEICVSRILSRNRLAGDDGPPSDLSFLSQFWVLEEELSGGTLPTARRGVVCTPVLALCLNCLAVMNFRQVTLTILV